MRERGHVSKNLQLHVDLISLLGRRVGRMIRLLNLYFFSDLHAAVFVVRRVGVWLRDVLFSRVPRREEHAIDSHGA